MKGKIDITELQEQHLNMMIKLAFDMEDAEEVQEILEESDPVLTADEEMFANAIFMEAMNASEQQNKREKRQQYAAHIRKVIPRLVEIAACLILIAALATPVALASSAAFRAQVMQLLMELDNERGEAYFSLVEDENVEFWVPEGWRGTHYPCYIPEGFNVYDFDSFFTFIEYRNEQRGQLFFAEYTSGASLVTGTENANVSALTVNGSKGYLVEGTASDGVTHTVTLIWQSDAKWFCVTGYDIDTNEVLMVASSVKEIVH